jgi:hypothetical protein
MEVARQPAKAVDSILDGQTYAYQLRKGKPGTGEIFLERHIDG